MVANGKVRQGIEWMPSGSAVFASDLGNAAAAQAVGRSRVQKTSLISAQMRDQAAPLSQSYEEAT